MVSVKKYLYLVGGFFLILFAAAFILYFSAYQKATEQIIVPTQPVRPTFIPKPTSIQPTEASFPSSPKIEISRILVNNFYLKADTVSENGDVLFGKTASYQFVYLPSDEQFLITVLGSPFEESRKEAELEFASELGISKEDACNLNVTLSTPYFANPDFAGRRFALSFCAHIP